MQITLLTFPWLVQPVLIVPNGALLVSVPPETPAREIERLAQALKEMVNRMLPGDDVKMQIILAYEGITVQGLDEKMMNRCGWQRIPNPPS